MPNPAPSSPAPSLPAVVVADKKQRSLASLPMMLDAFNWCQSNPVRGWHGRRSRLRIEPKAQQHVRVERGSFVRGARRRQVYEFSVGCSEFSLSCSEFSLSCCFSISILVGRLLAFKSFVAAGVKSASGFERGRTPPLVSCMIPPRVRAPMYYTSKHVVMHTATRAPPPLPRKLSHRTRLASHTLPPVSTAARHATQRASTTDRKQTQRLRTCNTKFRIKGDVSGRPGDRPSGDPRRHAVPLALRGAPSRARLLPLLLFFSPALLLLPSQRERRRCRCQPQRQQRRRGQTADAQQRGRHGGC